MIADIVNDLHHKVVEVGMEKGWVYQIKDVRSEGQPLNQGVLVHWTI